MAEHFKYYPSDEATVTPWNARFSYPSQANKAEKLTPRIPPKNGSTFNPGQQIFMDFPAQGYVNPLNTMINMDVVLIGPTNTQSNGLNTLPFACRFQNNIQCIFNRVRMLYGGNELEAMYNYNVIVRFLTETCATNQLSTVDGTSITDGVGGTMMATIPTFTTTSSTVTAATGGPGQTSFEVALGISSFPIGTYVFISPSATNNYAGIYQVVGGTSGSTGTIILNLPFTGAPSPLPSVSGVSAQEGKVNTRQAYIQGVEGNFIGAEGTPQQTLGSGSDLAPLSNSQALPAGISVGNAPFVVRRYQINLALGLLTQDKLIPTKYMASQLRIELTLEQANACIYQPVGFSSNITPPTYAVGNVLLIPEIIEFDDTYDSQFLAGLEGGGIPIKISTWHWYQFTTSSSSSLSLQIQERSRSVKGIVAIQRRGQASFAYDNHALLYDTNQAVNSTDGTTMTDYQYRLGGRYYPGAPVQLAFNTGSHFSNGGAESFQEMQKFLNNVGDYRLQPNVSVLNWAVCANTSTPINLLPEYDYSYDLIGYQSSGQQITVLRESAYSAYAGNLPSCCYANCINFETSNGVEISGLNAEEQSDIAYVVRWSAPQASGFLVECYPYIDKMLVLRPNNVLELIE